MAVGPILFKNTYDSLYESSPYKAYLFVVVVGLFGGIAALLFTLQSGNTVNNRIGFFFLGWIIGTVAVAIQVKFYPH